MILLSWNGKLSTQKHMYIEWFSIVFYSQINHFIAILCKNILKFQFFQSVRTSSAILKHVCLLFSTPFHEIFHQLFHPIDWRPSIGMTTLAGHNPCSAMHPADCGKLHCPLPTGQQASTKRQIHLNI